MKACPAGSKEAKHCKQSTVFSASACNGSNNGSGAWRWKQYGAGSGDREESDDPLYDAVKLGLDNTSGTVLGRHLCSKWKYQY